MPIGRGDGGAAEAVRRLADLKDGPRAFGDVLGFGAAVIPALEALLRSPPATVFEPRCLAADALKILGATDSLLRAFEDSASRRLDPILQESETVVLNVIAEHLGRLGDRRAVAPLLEVLRQHPYVGCVHALARVREPAALPLIVECLYDDSSRSVAATALDSYGRAPIPLLARVLCAPRIANGFESASAVDARATAAALLGRAGGAEVFLPLFWALQDCAVEVRLAAAEALAGLEDPAGEIAAPILVSLLDESWPRGERAAQALIQIDGPAIPALLAVAECDPIGVRSRQAIDLLGRLGAGSATQLLASLAKHSDDHLRFAAVVALERLAAPAALSVLEDYLEDPSAEIGGRAATALSHRGLPGATVLVRALWSGDPARVQIAEGALRSVPELARQAIRSMSPEPIAAGWRARWNARRAIDRLLALRV